MIKFNVIGKSTGNNRGHIIYTNLSKQQWFKDEALPYTTSNKFPIRKMIDSNMLKVIIYKNLLATEVDYPEHHKVGVYEIAIIECLTKVQINCILVDIASYYLEWL